MKLEKQLFKISLIETLILSILCLIAINVGTFLISLIKGEPRLFLYDTAWVLQIIFPFFLAITQTARNRNGVLKLTSFNDIETLTNKIDSLTVNKGYIATNSNIDNYKYVKKTKLGRLLNHFFRNDIEVKIVENSIEVFAKRNLLNSLETKLKYDKSL